jgi:hypothetical protein
VTDRPEQTFVFVSEFDCVRDRQGAEPVRPREESRVQAPRRPAARHGAGRFLERRTHPDRDHQLAVSIPSVAL